MSWPAALLLLFMGGCALVIGTSHHCPEYTSVSRMRGCISNLNSLDKCVGVWESQNVAIPMDRDAWLEMDSRGRITRVSDTVRELMDRWKIDPRVRLAPGATVLFDYSKDMNVFQCPSRVMQAGAELMAKHPESHYRWMASSRPFRAPGERKRGVLCLFHHDVGPRDQPDAVHRYR